jgi:cell division septal protein FtsQ
MWWHDEEYPTIRKRKNSRKRKSSREPLLLVNARVKEQRRMWRQRWTSVFILTLSLAAAVWLLLLGTQSLGKLLFSDNDQFVINELVIESDGSLVTARRVKEWAQIDEGMNLFDIDIEETQRKLSAMVPVIESVTIRRVLPDKMVIQVRERQALARLGRHRQGIPLALDREGYVLGPSSRSPNLPVVFGVRQVGLRPGSFLDSADVQDVLCVLNTCDTTRLGKYLKIASIDISDPTQMDLRLEGGARVLLSPSDVTQRMRKVAAILQTSEQKGLIPMVIDATGNNNFPVQYR